jgi:iron complex outermembrane receptor protein
MLPKISRRRHALLYTTAIVAILSSGIAHAQAAGGGENSQARPTDALQEVVVTATRQNDTVNRVPLSISAQTQRTLDQQGVRTVVDLQGFVPALQISQTSSGVAFPSIRGVIAAGSGVAATVGFYLDDTPLQKRNAQIPLPRTNGTPIPPLFDLDRVEVLRGPQGTLFGGGSEGGTIRYITPAPSLTRYAVYARGEVSSTAYGDPSEEAGVAINAPIVQDKLALRGSVWRKHTGGWIDTADRFSPGQFRYNNINSGDSWLTRLQVAWAPTEKSRITLGYFGSHEQQDSSSQNYNLPITSPIVQPAACYLNPPAGAKAPTYGAAVGFGDANCASLTAQGKANFTRPGATYGPYPNLGVSKQIAPLRKEPSATTLSLATLTIDYDFGPVVFKSISSVIRDQTKGVTSWTTYLDNAQVSAQYGNTVIPLGLTQQAACPYSCADQALFVSRNNRNGFTQEVRLSSPANASPFSWVGGFFYSMQKEKLFMNVQIDPSHSLPIYGTTLAQRFTVGAVPSDPTFTVNFANAPFLNGPANSFEILEQIYDDNEVAAFGEANYAIANKIKLTAGLRVSRLQSDYNRAQWGPVDGVALPSVANGGIVSGSTTEYPVTPRVTAQYQLSEKDMLYVTASKGFRAGGANAPIPASLCGGQLAAAGLQSSDLPTSYKSDTTWNYELGGKFRLFNNRVQLNGAVYRIDWNGTQQAFTPNGCGINIVVNAGAARSQGVELEAQARLFKGLSANAAFGYDDAKYTQGSSLGIQAVTVKDLPLVAQAPYTLNIGARYEADLSNTARGYIRGDWNWQSKKPLIPYPVAGFAPDAVNFSFQRTNVRAGVEYGAFDINVFVNNLFNNQEGNITGGRGRCPQPVQGGTAACVGFGSYNPFLSVTPFTTPRQVGLQIAYRH